MIGKMKFFDSDLKMLKYEDSIIPIFHNSKNDENKFVKF